MKEIEGDAVFLYAVRPGDDGACRQVCEAVGRKLLRFFEVFSAALVAESESTLCPCSVCRNLDQLKLKVVVHSGDWSGEVSKRLYRKSFPRRPNFQS